MNRELDFENDRSIDPDNLHEESVDQPDLMHEYGLNYEEFSYARDNAKLKMDIAKEELDQIKSQVSLEIREDPEDFGLKKATDESVKNATLVDDRVITKTTEYFSAVEEFNKAKHEAGVAYNALRAIEAKKASIENLIRLLGMQYFAQPSEPKDFGTNYVKKAKEDRTKETMKKKVRERRNQKNQKGD